MAPHHPRRAVFVMVSPSLVVDAAVAESRSTASLCDSGTLTSSKLYGVELPSIGLLGDAVHHFQGRGSVRSFEDRGGHVDHVAELMSATRLCP